MKILISKLPLSGWWNSGIPKYKDNPAMQEGIKPDLKKLKYERKNLISILKNEKHDVIEIEFPKNLDKRNQKHDFIFVRDHFISNQKNKIIILRSGEPLRRIENTTMKNILNKIGYNTIQMPNMSGMRADGGEFYFCAKENILFSGIQRNTQSGIEYVSNQLKINELIILNGNGYHLDTFFTPVLNNENILCAVISCCEMLTNQSKKDLYNFCNKKQIPIFNIPLKDAIGTSKKIGSFAVNSLPLPGLLISPNNFSNPTIDKDLLNLGIKRLITPTSQYELSGGSIHCITNEL